MKYFQSWQDFMRDPDNKALKESKGIHACKQKYIQEQEKQMYLKMPEMKDPEKASVVRTDMKRYLTDTGYSQSEVANLTDHRMLLILKDAMAYRKLQATKPGLTKKVSSLIEIRSGSRKK